MLIPFVCGTFHNEHDDEPCLASPNSSSPRKYKRKNSKNNNPYSTSGLDKFSDLLADLDEKRQKIYSQTNPHDISFVRFVYSNTDDDIVPVVVKVKNNNKDHRHSKSQELKVVRARTTTTTTTLTHNTSESMDKSTTADKKNPVEERKQHKIETHEKVDKKNSNNFSWDMGKPSFYVPVVMILILLLFVVFGRSVTILCICILWYVMPTSNGSSSSSNTLVRARTTTTTTLTHNTSESTDKSTTADKKNPAEERKQHKIETHAKVAKKNNNFSWDMGKPSFYVPVVTMILILLLLVVFGRSVTTLCICILWYVMSTLKGSSSSSNTLKSINKKDLSEKKIVINEGTKKKNYVRGWSEKKTASTDELISPRSGD